MPPKYCLLSYPATWEDTHCSALVIISCSFKSGLPKPWEYSLHMSSKYTSWIYFDVAPQYQWPPGWHETCLGSGSFIFLGTNEPHPRYTNATVTESPVLSCPHVPPTPSSTPAAHTQENLGRFLTLSKSKSHRKVGPRCGWLKGQALPMLMLI